MVALCGACFGRQKKLPSKENEQLVFPLHFSEAQVCDYFVDTLPSRLQGDGLHLLRAGPGPIVAGWTHELLDEAGVHSFQDRELLLKIRDQMTVAVAEHRHRRRTAFRANSTKVIVCAPVADGDSGTPHSHGYGSQATCSPRSSGDVDANATGLGAGGDAAAAAAKDSMAAAKLAAEEAAAAAASNGAERLSSDGRPFHLQSDRLHTRLSLYRISEDRAEALRHMASSSCDPSVRALSPCLSPCPTGLESEDGTEAAGTEAAAEAPAAGDAAAASTPRQVGAKSRFGPSADGAAPADGAEGADAVAATGAAGPAEGAIETASSSSSCGPASVCDRAVAGAEAEAGTGTEAQRQARVEGVDGESGERISSTHTDVQDGVASQSATEGDSAARCLSAPVGEDVSVQSDATTAEWTANVDAAACVTKVQACTDGSRSGSDAPRSALGEAAGSSSGASRVGESEEDRCLAALPALSAVSS